MAISTRQTLIYVFLAICTCVIATIAYFSFNQDWINYHKGEQFFRKKNFSEAIHYYQIALDKGLSFPKVYLRMGDANTALGNFTEAIKLYRLYISYKPKDRIGHLALARALSYIKEYKESEEEYKKLTEGHKDE